MTRVWFGAKDTCELFHDKVRESGVRDHEMLLTHGELGERRDVANSVDTCAGFRGDVVLSREA